MKRSYIGILAGIVMSLSTLATFGQTTKTVTVPCRPVVHHKASATPTAPKPQAPTPQPITITNENKIDLQPLATMLLPAFQAFNGTLDKLAAAAQTAADAKEMEADDLDTLHGLTPDQKTDLRLQYAKAKIEEKTSQTNVNNSVAKLNNAEAAFTNKKDKHYVWLHLVDDVASVGGAYLGAPRVNIDNGIAGSGNSGGATIENSGNSTNSNTNSNTTKVKANGGAGGAGGAGGDATAIGMGGNANASSAASSTAQQSQGQNQGQSQAQSDTQTQNNTQTGGDTGGGTKPPSGGPSKTCKPGQKK